jgi:DNA processing protein
MSIKENPLHILLHARGLGRTKVWNLIEQFGSAEKVLQQGRNGQTRLLFGKWEISNWEQDLELAEKEGVRLVTYQEKEYPKDLLDIPDFPLLLYVKGEWKGSVSRQVAIIGTRNATLYGKQMASKIAKTVAMAGVCVISGLARGIDTAAHEGALAAGGQTLAVIGSGLGNLYPPENRLLAEKIASSGAVISEFPMAMAPAKGLFPRRNRIVSGLADGVCLIESPIEGGGMITMHIAELQNKPLFALPGRVDWPTFGGNHRLIKQKKALLVENGEDLLKYFDVSENQEINTQHTPLLTPEEKALLDMLPNEEKSIEELVLLTQLPIMHLNVCLIRLVLKKVVKEFPGKIYKRIGLSG